MPLMAIDPGHDGAIVVFGGAESPTAYPMPVVQIRTAKSLDADAILALLKQHRPARVLLEKQLAYKGKGSTGLATAFYNLGLIAGMCLASGAEVEYIHPRTWQAGYPPDYPAADLPNSGIKPHKHRHVCIATSLYPEVSLKRPRSKHPYDGIADALLMGHYWLQT